MSGPSQEQPAFDPVAHLLKGWKVVAASLALGISASVVYLLLAPKWYTATLAVLPSSSPGSSKSAALSIAANLPAAFDTVSTDVHRIQAVLQSTSVSDEVIAKFNLDKRYGTTHLEHTRKELWRHCSTSADRKSGLVALSCEDKDPEIARAITEQFGEVGNRVFRRISASSAREERRFLETQVEKARQDVVDVSQKLRAFQELHKIVDLPEQSKAVISAMASIKGELISKQLELSYLSSFSSRTESNVLQLQQQISIMESKLQQLEASQQIAVVANATGSGSGSTAKSDFFPGAMTVPELRFELEQLFREQKIKETVFFLLTQRYETAKVDEARDTSTFQILDMPTAPSYPTFPNKKKVLATGLAGGAGVGVGLVLLPLWWRRRMNRTPHVA
jgi:tyrosine-protein kinase Etk/Wzc